MNNSRISFKFNSRIGNHIDVDITANSVLLLWRH